MSFDRLAPIYDAMEAVLAGPRLQRCRTTWLNALDGCQRVLIAGVGHGRFLDACLPRLPHTRITCVDASAKMLARAQERSGAAAARVEFVHARLPEWQPEPAAYDAIVTNFFLDCFPVEELGAVVSTLARAAKPGAKWLVTDFAVPSQGFARGRARAVHALMYAFFRPVTGIRARRVTPPDSFLTASGFSLAGRRDYDWGLLRADLWQRG